SRERTGETVLDPVAGGALRRVGLGGGRKPVRDRERDRPRDGLDDLERVRIELEGGGLEGTGVGHRLDSVRRPRPWSFTPVPISRLLPCRTTKYKHRQGLLPVL